MDTCSRRGSFRTLAIMDHPIETVSVGFGAGFFASSCLRFFRFRMRMAATLFQRSSVEFQEAKHAEKPQRKCSVAIALLSCSEFSNVAFPAKDRSLIIQYNFCISYFSYQCGRIPDRRSLREEGFY